MVLGKERQTLQEGAWQGWAESPGPVLLALCHTPPARCTVFAALAAPCGVLASDIKGSG